MPQPQFEVALGAVDGFNVNFATPTPYQAGTLAVFLNGQLLNATQYTPIDPTSGAFQMTEAPQTLDIVQVFYIDTSPVLPGEEILPLSGTINSGAEIVGTLSEDDLVVNGTLVECDCIVGTIVGCDS